MNPPVIDISDLTRRFNLACGDLRIGSGDNRFFAEIRADAKAMAVGNPFATLVLNSNEAYSLYLWLKAAIATEGEHEA